MQYQFSIIVNIKNQKIIKCLFNTEHGDANSFPDAQHEQEISSFLSDQLGEAITRDDIFIMEMHLLGNTTDNCHLSKVRSIPIPL